MPSEVARTQFQDSLHGLLSWFLDVRSLTIDQEGEHRARALAEHLACCYRRWGMPKPSGRAVLKAGIPLDAASYGREDSQYRGRVLDLCAFVRERMGGHLTHFFIHGSLATLDYAQGWSDVDSFMVISQEAVTDGSRLLELRKECLAAWPLFLRMTPLQHHGFLVATEGDLRAYPSYYMPLAVFDTALAVLPGQRAAKFHIRSKDGGSFRSLSERRDCLESALKDGVFRHHPRQGICLEARFRNADNAMGQLHALLEYVMGVPCFLMDALGEPCYKKESFVRGRPLFSEKAWEIVDRASQIRRTWPSREGTGYSGNAVPQWLREILGPDYIEKSFLLLDEAVAVARARQDPGGSAVRRECAPSR